VEAQAIYERLIRDYADQKDAVMLARARIASKAAAAPVKGDRSVWTGFDADGFGTISPDGKVRTYTDWKNGAALALRDLTTGSSYRLASGADAVLSNFQDGKQVAYDWFDQSSPGGRPHNIVSRDARHEHLGSRRSCRTTGRRRTAPGWSPRHRDRGGRSQKDGTHQIKVSPAFGTAPPRVEVG
jgi:hypothetical protein